MRYILLHSLIFLENLVRKPLQEKYDNPNLKKEIADKAKIIMNDLFKVIKNEENNEINQIMKNQKIQKQLNSKILTIFNDDLLI